jgi:WD40 repeat protein
VIKNVDDPDECFIYRGHATPVSVAKFSPNGFWVASADISGKVRVWSWDNPEHLTKLETSVFAGSVTDLDWDSDSKKLVVVGEGSGILVKCITWDTGNSAGEMLGHNKRVLSVSYKPTRPFRIMTASEDMKSLFYAGPPFKLDHSNSSHSNFVNCVRYSHDGLRVVSVGSDRKIQMYDGATGLPTGEIAGAHEGGIYSVSFSPNGQNFVTASADKTVKLWDSETLALLQIFTFSAHPQLSDAQVAVLWTYKDILSVSLNGNINVLDRNSPALPSRVIYAHQAAISALHIDLTTQMLYTGSCDGVVCSRSFESVSDTVKLLGGDERNIFGAVHGNKVVGLVVNDQKLWSSGWDDVLRSAEISSGTYDGEVALVGQPIALVSTAGSNLFLSVTVTEIALYRGMNKVASLPMSGLGFSPTCGAIFGESEVAVGGSDNKTHIFSVEGLVFVETAVVETRSAVSSVAYDPRGELLAIGDAGRQVEVYERGTWEPRVKGKWVFHTSRVTALAWSPSGDLLASGSLDENIFVWNLNKPAVKIQLAYAHTGGVTSLSWASENRLVSGGNDHSIVTWKISDV